MEGGRRKEFAAVDHGRRKGRDGQGDYVMQLFGREVSGIQQERRSVCVATSVETPVDLRTRTKQLGAKEKARRKRCDARFSIARRNHAFQKNYVRIGVRKLLRWSMVLARVRKGQAVGIALTERG